MALQTPPRVSLVQLATFPSSLQSGSDSCTGCPAGTYPGLYPNAEGGSYVGEVCAPLISGLGVCDSTLAAAAAAAAARTAPAAAKVSGPATCGRGSLLSGDFSPNVSRAGWSFDCPEDTFPMHNQPISPTTLVLVDGIIEMCTQEPRRTPTFGAARTLVLAMTQEPKKIASSTNIISASHSADGASSSTMAIAALYARLYGGSCCRRYFSCRSIQVHPSIREPAHSTTIALIIRFG